MIHRAEDLETRQEEEKDTMSMMQEIMKHLGDPTLCAPVQALLVDKVRHLRRIKQTLRSRQNRL